MISLDTFMIPASKSLTLTDKIPNGNIQDCKMIVGCDGEFEYHSLLYFNISSLPNNIIVTKAELTLFKCDCFYDDKSAEFILYPIYDHFSLYTTYFRIPSTDKFSGTKFYPMISKSTIAIDITHIVSSWIKNISSNKGIMISNIWNNYIASFGSALAKKQHIVPFITIAYEHNSTEYAKNSKSHCSHDFHLSVQIVNSCNPIISPNPSLTEVIATGTIEQHSIFVVIIELVVTRDNGTIDKYYVSDEYINSTDEPLNINKTYSIPVVPALNTCDLVTSANIYGAYRGYASI
ncbi:DNRLRE domain-containing protein [Clostridium tyrobutyricum]|uniref:DNRLRE domain-containing protein n=2 Tax=Clostridium tyrobutyricum TaxID=1519 RepID=UPI001F36CBA5|nr:DNRLRE domain-containing protein [Clostridium tyrobutyricum]MCH4201206.1 DNRLRE domain-containing protein [Clostridium tyrobutyricum]MCI1240465.1 DNRLRE domain-containing protein [Clostridium tyrobutyricum]MCI1652598.1 DNRLRE domain-containing protein [Clostridium tyrobutyricum]MCI1938793.1 DNRLRE domain-containing protein [Clostridium tyrobutyricum]MCI2005862.1 DNRLRE domain-containing protein [Clostridium tyrobutyricum]